MHISQEALRWSLNIYNLIFHKISINTVAFLFFIAERERKEKEKRELERREIERERMLQQQRMNEMKPSVQNNVICHDRSPLRNGCDTDIRIKEESRKDEDVLRNDPSRYSSSSNPMIGSPSHAYLSSRHPQHVLGVSPSHLSRSILPHPGTSLSHYPPPPSVWSGVDPYRDPYRLDPMTPLRYNPLMEAMRVEEERAKAMYAAHSALHYRPKDPASFPMLHHRIPSTPMNSMKPNGPPHVPPVNSDALKKDDSSQNR